MAASTQPTRRFAFSQAKVAALPASTGERTYYRDTRCMGLIVAVFKSGARTFYRYGRIDGRPVRYKLGTFPATTVEQARKLCSQATGNIAEGRDPHRLRQVRRREPTLQDLFTWWHVNHSVPFKKTHEADQWFYDKYLKPWGSRRLSNITKADVLEWHRRIAREVGPHSANRARGLLGTLFNRSDELGFVGPNPTRGVRRFSERSRERFLQPDELPRFFAALEAEPTQDVRHVVGLLLWTAQRKGSVMQARWQDVDLAQSVWRIPPEHSKNGKSILVHLAEPAKAILQQRLDTRGESPWVFPSHSKSGRLEHIDYCWKKILARAGLENLRPHDLRRTVGSWLAIGGANLPVIAAVLGHSSLAATGVYARLSTDTASAALDDVTQRLLAAATSTKGARHGKAK